MLARAKHQQEATREGDLVDRFHDSPLVDVYHRNIGSGEKRMQRNLCGQRAPPGHLDLRM
jgi:hypothetical protein